MKRTILGLFAAAALFSGVARAAEPSAAAQTRAGLYQREVRASLAARGWRITQDEAGKLTAEHRWVSRNGTTGFVLADGTDSTYARLQIDFQADGKDHTNAAARASLCFHDSPSSPRTGFEAYPPLALRDPKLTQEYLDVLAEANSHLTTGHRSVSDAGKIAMK